MVDLARLLFARVLRGSARARFFAVGLFFALVPVCATAPNDRLLLGASFGTLGLVALFLANVWETRGALRWVAAACAAFLALRHVVLAPPLLPVRAVASARACQGPADLAAATMPTDPGAKDATLVGSTRHTSSSRRMRSLPSSPRGGARPLAARAPSASTSWHDDRRTYERP